ncbi:MULTISPECIES: precorrin-6y C5,15-methyltransferase (decarboxylating) subunit CbiE [Streptomyces]|uniref:precorrin-6y C5,15-methyltransferase (decarboxylating) subunit CbiE n=1 Tax=Streptomyces TaxID=1883 RepID=UPI00163C987C|nr:MULTISPECIES: precorrin-6y C5,15-methyltransferase (decarboxylating) subunit CbiE [Streptomyces]MCM3266225.1 precorrin-6y C5,15-methyltransferase (decarboxylating) subunit CbiE [Streptomyces thermoviolaceus]WTD49749.1 precorrin-6y C5,15-methyltransferase (decarboxylating) subunit CbiE [Streptomyces thermoviolaceus]GGV81373.1 precorrin-6y C5,15-methyltransferase subunit CbiE [Streptomyces thermoviolaceus subsp. apingens]GHA78139.1 precorrin-6y C5,15-methyltransferase subunit CbiE [Streptomyce
MTAAITVVGTGTGGPYDTGVLAGAELVVGARRHLDAAPLPETARRVVLGPLAPALDVVAEHVAAERRVVVLASGDPGFFGIVRALAERFGPERLHVRPGVSSVAAAFARIALPWDDAVVVSAHGRGLRRAVSVCRARPKVAVLTGPGAGPAELGAALADPVCGERILVVASALGEPGRERVERVTPAEAAARDWGGAVNVVLCLDPARTLGGVRTVAGAAPPPAGWALPEEAFAHRDSMITKFEVRALALARLGPRLGDLVWDVGAGSGSVAVECARLGAAVVAVEKDADGAARVRANAAAHGVDVAVVPGRAPEALAGLRDDPDAVFVGGGGRELPAVVAACARRARRTVVVALAALDRVPVARAALTEAGFVCDGVLLHSSRLAPLPGDVTRLAAANPVFLLWGERPAASSEGVVQ